MPNQVGCDGMRAKQRDCNWIATYLLDRCWDGVVEEEGQELRIIEAYKGRAGKVQGGRQGRHRAAGCDWAGGVSQVGTVPA